MVRLHRLYYLLALFNALTVAASLYIGHEMIDIVRSSVQGHRVTQSSLDRFSELGRLAQAANLPVNDVFADRAIDLHADEFREAAAAFAAAVEAERQEAGRLPADEQAILVIHLDDAHTAMAAMERDAAEVFVNLRAGKVAEAASAMARADRNYSRISGTLRQMRGDAVRLQARLLDRQEVAANNTRWYELATAFAVLVMVATAAIYGQQSASRLQRVDKERSAHLAALEEAQASLRTQAAELERRVEERTAALAESERHMAEAQRLANIGSWSWDIGSGAVVWSEQQYRVMGYEPGTVTPSFEVYLQSLHPDDRERAQQAAYVSVETGQPFTIPLRVLQADGSVRYIEGRGRAMRAADGRVIGLSGTSQDITAAHLAARARFAAEERFRNYVETTAEWVWELDLRGHITYSNRAVYDILGYEPDELLGRDVRPLVEPAARAATERLLPEVIAGRQRWNGLVRRFRHKNGEWRFLESSGMTVLDEKGEVSGVRGAERDVTERKLAELALRESEERFQLVLRATNDILWDWNIRSGSITWSDSLRTHYGHADAPTSVDGWVALIHPADADRIGHSLHEFLASDRSVWSGEYRFARGDGSYAWVFDRGIVVRDRDGQPARMAGSMADITERKEAERMKSDFVSFVSHQLRTPISGMNWMLELAAEAENLPEQARDYITEARESASRLGTLVNDLLDIARLESGRTVMAQQPVRLDELTRSVLREMQTVILGKRHNVNLDATGAAPAIGDEQMLRQAIANLLSNAVKYTPDGGRIDIQVTQRKNLVEWSVSDNGMGIPQVAQGRLFEKFYRAENAVSKEAEGTGLGLHLVRLVVEHAGGQIWCESEEGEGARFTFTLPVVQQEGVRA